LSTLQHCRSEEDSLSEEAKNLCDVLLSPDPDSGIRPETVVPDTNFEAKMAARRRDEFLRSYSFNGKEREEVLAALARLGSAEERGNTIIGFDVNGARETSEVVDLFRKHVDEVIEERNDQLAKQRAAIEELRREAPEDLEAEVGESESESADEENGEDEVVDEKDVQRVDSASENSDAGFGPVSLHSKFVKCKVCGAQEKVDRVEFPALKIRLSCRTSTDTEQAEPLRRLLNGGTSCNYWDWDWSEEHPDGQRWDSWHEKSSKVKPPQNGVKKTAEAVNGSSYNQEEQRRLEVEEQMRQDLYAHLQEKGCRNIPGPGVAGLFAIRYNQFLRTDKRRNDGQVRKWIASQPGVTVESVGGNQWNVHLDLQKKWEAERKKIDKGVWKVKAKD